MILKKVFVALFILTLTLKCSNLSFIGNKALGVLSNQPVQKYGSALCFWGYAYYDATSDAVLFQNRNQMLWGEEHFPIHGRANYESWHRYKNVARSLLIISASLKGMEVGQHNSTMYRVAKRSFYEALIAWNIWQWRKHYIQTGNALDYSEAHNKHLFVFPFIDKDRYIGLKGWQIGGFQCGIGVLGVYGFITN